MGKSLQLGSVAGIRLQVHWTFALLIVWVALSAAAAGSGLVQTVVSVAFVIVIFGCVILHELGHALAARAFGIPTRHITLLPIGGVASLERMPRKPQHELVVALAGPAVNVVIATVLLAILISTRGLGSIGVMMSSGGGFLSQLMLVNVLLVVFNLLPAFPMDGGRVLRALLAMVIDYNQATRIAAITGQFCALGLALLGFLNPFLFFVAAFVFFAAAAEARQVAVREAIGGTSVSDGMIRFFRVVPADAQLHDLAEQLLDDPQRDFPVVRVGQFVGMLNRDVLLDALLLDDAALVADVMHKNVQPVEETDPLIAVLEKAIPGDGDTIPVTKAGALTGLLDLNRVFHLVKARANLEQFTQQSAARPLRTPAPNLA